MGSNNSKEQFQTIDRGTLNEYRELTPFSKAEILSRWLLKILLFWLKQKEDVTDVKPLSRIKGAYSQDFKVTFRY